MLITDKMIEDVRCSICVLTKDRENGKCINFIKCKQEIKDKGYEVEKGKSKLDEAREYVKKHNNNSNKFPFITYGIMNNLSDKYEQAITEIKEKHEDEMMKWQDAYVKKHQPIDENLINYLKINKNLSHFSCEDCTKTHEKILKHLEK